MGDVISFREFSEARRDRDLDRRIRAVLDNEAVTAVVRRDADIDCLPSPDPDLSRRLREAFSDD